MIWRWAICSRRYSLPLAYARGSVICVCLMALAPGLIAGDVTGRVELIDSRDPGVRKHGDRSGVVISLNPVSSAEVAVGRSSLAISFVVCQGAMRGAWAGWAQT